MKVLPTKRPPPITFQTSLPTPTRKTVWVATTNGLVQMDTAGLILKKLFAFDKKIAPENSGNIGRVVFVQQNGLPVCLTHNGHLIIPNWEGKRFMNGATLFKNCNAYNKVNGNVISAVTASGDSVLYITYGRPLSEKITTDTLMRYNLRNHSWQKLMWSRKQVPELGKAFILPGETLMIASYFGNPFFYDLRLKKQVYPETPPPIFTSVPDGINMSVLTDGPNMWIGTGKELYQVKLTAPAFEAVTEADSLLNRQESLVGINEARSNGTTMAITAMGAGTLIWDILSGRCRMYNYPKDMVRYSVSTGMYFHDNDTIWNNSYYGVNYIDLKTGRSGQVSNATKPAMLDSISGVNYLTKSGHIWYAGRGRLYEFDPATKKFTQRPYPLGKTGKPLINRVRSIAEDDQGDLYFGGSSGGIVKLYTKTGQWETFIQTFSNRSYSSSLAGHIVIYKNKLYLQAEYAFVEVDMHTRKYDIYTKTNGLSTTNIQEMAADRNGYIWIATPNGLNCFNPRLKNFTTYYVQDGLPSDYVSSVGMIDSVSNLMYIGTEKHFRLFKPDVLLGEKKAPHIVITGLQSLRGEWLGSGKELLQLRYNRNDFIVAFTGINFDNGSLNTYMYRMVGLDNDWIYAGGNRTATFTNLSPGMYTFEVKSANRQGIWNDEPAVVRIEIVPPFWKTSLFIVVCYNVLMLAIFFTFRYQSKLSRKKEAEKIHVNNQLNELRMKALRSQLNPHFIFNALNSIQSYVLDNNVVEASRYLSKFAKLFRLVLDNSDTNFTTLQKEIQLLNNYIELESLRLNHSFSYKITVTPDINQEKACIPSMLLQPHIENAILHGLFGRKDGHLLILFFRQHENSITCSIQDNGIGRKRSSEINRAKFKTHESKGMRIIQQRIQLLSSEYDMSSSYQIDDLEGTEGMTGTRVTVELPLQNKLNT